jgi:RNA polymerase sigma factor (sigma-70 family)
MNEGTISLAASALNDGEVVVRIQAGEPELYGILVARHNRRLQRILRRILRNPCDVEDVLQEAHLHALRHLTLFEGRSVFFTWLSRIAVNEAYTHLRRLRKHQPLDVPLSAESIRPKHLTAQDLDPEQNAIRKELRSLLESAVKSLPSPYRAVVSIRAIGETASSEAANSLGLSEQGVKTRLFRATHLLRRKMRPNLEAA